MFSVKLQCALSDSDPPPPILLAYFLLDGDFSLLSNFYPRFITKIAHGALPASSPAFHYISIAARFERPHYFLCFVEAD